MKKLRKLTQETLEERRVLTTWAPLGEEAFAEASVLGELVQWQASGERGALEKFESAEAAEQQLSEWSSEAFEDLFGQEVRTDFWWARGHESNTRRDLRSAVVEIGESIGRFAASADDFSLPQFIGADPLLQGQSGKIAASSDGSALYALHRDSLFVISVDGEQSDVVQHFELGGLSRELLIQDDNLVVVSTSQSGGWIGHDALAPLHGDRTTQITLFDISDPLNLSSVSQATVEGGFREARIADGTLHLSVDGHQMLPLLGTVENEDGGGLRYETETEFLDRLSGQFLESVTPTISYEGSEQYLVEWDDIAHFGHWDFQSVTVASFDLEQELALLDSEFVSQVGLGFDDLEDDSMLIVNQRPLQGEAEITQLQFEAGQWNAIASGSVAGRVLNESMIDEHDGMIRVATVAPLDGETAEEDSWSSDLRILQADGNSLEVVGELIDLADGQHLFGAFYTDDIVMLTTAEVEGFMPIFDPLHAIDLSDPENPVEVSQLDIPGVTTQLAAVDSTRLLGLGAVEGDDGVWRPQVSLYDASSLEELKVVETWTGEQPTSPPSLGRLGGLWGQRQGQIFDYDATSGMLIFDSPGAGRFVDRIGIDFDDVFPAFFEDLHEIDMQPSGATVIQVNADSEQVFDELGQLIGNSSIDVGAQGSLVFSLEYGAVIIGDSSDLDSQVRVELDKPKAPPPPMVNDDRATVNDGESVTIDVLSNDRLPEGATIISVSEGEFGQVSINDQNEVVYLDAQLPGSLTRTDSFTYTVELESGETLTGEVRVTIFPVADLLEIQLAGALINQDGIAVDRVIVGEEYQLELSADWLGEEDQGIYQMIFEVVFDPTIFEVAGEPQALGGFENGRVAVATDTGFSAIGGFSNSLSPIGEGPQRIVSIPLRVLAEGSSTINIGVNPEDGPVYETLVFGVDVAIPDSQVSGSQLVIESGAAAAAMPQDVNADGMVSASDALQIVNYLNQQQAERQASLAEGEATFSKLDVNRDGIVAASDVLSIVNLLNERSRGEGESPAVVQDFYFEDIEKEKAGLPLFGPELLDLVIVD